MKMTVENIALAMENVNSNTTIIVYELDGTRHDFYGYKDLMESGDLVVTQEVVNFRLEKGNRLVLSVNN